MQVLNFAAWADTGMAATPAFRAVARGVPQLTAAQALRALCDATTIDAAQLLVLDSSSVTASPAPAPVAPRAMASPVRDVVAGLIAAELGQRAEDLDDDTSFLAMGLDSLTAVDLVKTLEQELGRPLPTTLLFEYPSVSALSTYLSDPPSHQLAIQGTRAALRGVVRADTGTGRVRHDWAPTSGCRGPRRAASDHRRAAGRAVARAVAGRSGAPPFDAADAHPT
jgi:acyl carrier protein